MNNNNSSNDHVGYDEKNKNNLPICVGPWGSHKEGDPWDDGVHSTVKQLVIVHGAAGIDSIKIEYVNKGTSSSSVWSQKHGGSGGIKTDKIKLSFPNEFLNSISGHYGCINDWGPVFIRSLTFESSRKTYGPFGTQQGTHFSFPMTGGKIVGFHGQSSWYLTAIGVYLKPLHDQKSISPSKALMKSQSFVANDTDDQNGYSSTVVQGSIGKDYDMVLPVRQKWDFNNSQSNDLQMQISSSSTGDQGKPNNKVMNLLKLAYVIGFRILQNDFVGTRDLSRNWNPICDVLYHGTSPSIYRRNLDFSLFYRLMVMSCILEYGASLNPILRTYTRKGSSNFEGIISYGPWGGNGGTTFDDEVYTGVRQVNLTRSAAIVSIKVLYDRNGLAIWENKNGGTGGIKSDKIIFDYPFEAMTHITGYYGPLMFMGPTVVKSLTFHTTERKYGPFGDEQGTFFSSYIQEGMVIGFHGRGGWFLDSIGVHVLKGKLSTTRRSLNVYFDANNTMNHVIDHRGSSNKLVLESGGPNDEVIVKEPVPCGPGPWGGDGGKPWDDGVYTGIKQIYLTKGEAIFSVQIEYDREGRSVWLARHGGSGGATTTKVKFDYPQEVLTCISGYYGSIGRDERVKVIKSLTFYTSRGKYGPFGEEIGVFFTSPMTEGKVVGFHGRSSMYLDAIGVHMQHWLGNNQKPMKSMISKIFK